jgi:hypothetical protein
VIETKAKQIAKEIDKQMKVEDLLKWATHDLHVEKKVSRTMIATSQQEAADSLKIAAQQLIRAQTVMDDAAKKVSVVDDVIGNHNRLVRCAIRGSVKQQVNQLEQCSTKLTVEHDKHTSKLTKQFDQHTLKLTVEQGKHTLNIKKKHSKELFRLESAKNA